MVCNGDHKRGLVETALTCCEFRYLNQVSAIV